MRILFFGDVFGDEGMTAIEETLSKWKDEHQPDFVLANAENSADGRGVTVQTLDRLMKAGVQGFTSGDHFRDKGFSKLTDYPIIRPGNLVENHPGTGFRTFETALHRKVLVVNLLGKPLMGKDATNFYEAADDILSKEVTVDIDAVVVDFHASTTAEKQSLGFHLDGRVSAVVGTHTHVPTADTRLLPKGSAFQSDVGMCGAYDTVIGMEPDRSHAFILRQDFGEDVPRPPRRSSNPPYFCDAVLIETDGPTKSKSIRRLTTRPQA